MVQYSKPPPLDKLNPIQRYLQKGELEITDYLRLAVIVLAYILARPWIEWLMKKYFEADPFKTSQEARQSAKADRKAAKAKISAAEIRGGAKPAEGEEEESTAEGKDTATTSGRDSEPVVDEIVLRRGPGGSEFTAKTLQQQLLDWDDLDAKKLAAEGGGPKGDVMEWVGKWDQ